MTADRCRPWRELIGVYVLGHIAPEERAALEAHLEGCPECRAERDLLSPLADLLPLADPAWLGVAPEPPTGLGRSVVRRVEAERRVQRRRWLRVGVLGGLSTAAAAVLALVVFGGSAPAPAGAHVDFAGLPRGVRIGAHIEPRAWGSNVSVYVHGMRRGTRCEVFLRSADGQRVDAGSFRYSWQDDAGSDLAAAIRLSDARAIGIHVGHRTFTAPIPAAAS